MSNNHILIESNTPEKQSSPRVGFIRKCWDGKFKPLKTLLFVGIAGFLLTNIIIIILSKALGYYSGHPYRGLVGLPFYICHWVFFSLCFWRSVKNSLSPIKSILAVIVILLYSLGVLYTLYIIFNRVYIYMLITH